MTASTGKGLISNKRSRSIEPPTFSVNGFSLERVETFKYLGIQFSSDLSWHSHTKALCKKSRKLVGLLHRNFATHSPPSVMLKLYKSFIRPKLEYASIVWNPHLKCIIKDMEKVQKFALKVCLKQWDYSISYLELLKRAELPTLGQRRALASLHHLFKIMYNISYYEDTPKKRQLTYNTRYVNNLSLTPVSCRTSVHNNSFFPRTIELWNRIMANRELIISTCTPLKLFKSMLNPFPALIKKTKYRINTYFSLKIHIS